MWLLYFKVPVSSRLNDEWCQNNFRKELPTWKPCNPREDHLLVAIWKGFLWIMTEFYCVCIHNYSDIKKLSPLSVIYEKKNRACSLRIKWVNEIEPPCMLSKFSHILFYGLKWVWGIFKSILSFMSWVISHGNAVKLLSGFSSPVKYAFGKQTNKQTNRRTTKTLKWF